MSRGAAGMDVTLAAYCCGGETRADAEITLVLPDRDTIHPRQWPEKIRARAIEYLNDAQPDRPARRITRTPGRAERKDHGLCGTAGSAAQGACRLRGAVW